jgi:hypothetical protein
MISLCVNTCCLERPAKPPLSSGQVTYDLRRYALMNWILPQYIADPYIDEVIVTGAFMPGEDYTYIESPSEFFSWRDCIQQRQLGFEASKGDVLIFQHDDHVLEPTSDTAALWIDELACKHDGYANTEAHTADVLSPARYTRLRSVNGERLNNGEKDDYISGHCAIYRREVIETCQWKDVPPSREMDIEHTKQMRAAGFKLVHTDAIKIWDVEAGAKPWI